MSQFSGYPQVQNFNAPLIGRSPTLNQRNYMASAPFATSGNAVTQGPSMSGANTVWPTGQTPGLTPSTASPGVRRGTAPYASQPGGYAGAPGGYPMAPNVSDAQNNFSRQSVQQSPPMIGGGRPQDQYMTGQAKVHYGQQMADQNQPATISAPSMSMGGAFGPTPTFYPTMLAPTPAQRQAQNDAFNLQLQGENQMRYAPISPSEQYRDAVNTTNNAVMAPFYAQQERLDNQQNIAMTRANATTGAAQIRGDTQRDVQKSRSDTATYSTDQRRQTQQDTNQTNLQRTQDTNQTNLQRGQDANRSREGIAGANRTAQDRRYSHEDFANAYKALAGQSIPVNGTDGKQIMGQNGQPVFRAPTPDEVISGIPQYLDQMQKNGGGANLEGAGGAATTEQAQPDPGALQDGEVKMTRPDGAVVAVPKTSVQVKTKLGYKLAQ